MHLLWGNNRWRRALGWLNIKTLARRWREAIFVLVIIGLALFLRLYRLDLAQFQGDEAMVLSLAIGIADRVHFPLVGIPSSIGLPNPPLFPYLIALPLLVQRDVLATYTFVVLLNVAAVGLTCFLTWRYFGRIAAVVAGLLYAVGFWPVFFSRFIWAQNILPIFTVLMGICLFEAILRRRRWFFVLACLFAGLAAQVHFSALAYLPLLLIVALLSRRRLGRAIFLGAVVAALTFTPYLYNNLRSGATSVRQIVGLVHQSGTLQGRAWVYPAQLLGHLGYQNVEAGVAEMSFDVRWASWIEAGLLGIGVVYVGARALVRRREVEDGARYGLLVLWALVPVLVFTRSSYLVYEHYFFGQYPVLFAIIGVVMGDGVQLLTRKFSASGVGPWLIGAFPGVVLAAIAGAQVYFNLISVTYFAQGHGPAVRLGQMREALTEAGRAQDAANGSPIWIIAPGDHSQVGSLSQLFEPLGQLNLGTQTLGGAHTLVWREVAIPQVYLSAQGSGPADQFLRQELAAVPKVTIEDIKGAPFMDVFAVTPSELETTAQQAFTPVDWRSTVGVRLLGNAFEPKVIAGETLSIALWWEVEDKSLLNSDSDERFFVHIAPGKHAPQVAQVDGIGYANWRWVEGDRVISWFSVYIPPTTLPGEYFVRVGLYDLKSMERAYFFNDQGQTETDLLLFGPVHIEGPR